MLRHFQLLSILFLGICFTTGYGQGLPQPTVLTDNGAWCWFSDPRAVYYDGKTYTGWVKDDGSVEVGAFDYQTGAVTTQIIYPRLEVDDHNNPAFVIRPDGHLLAFYTKHHKEDLYVSVTKNPEDITAWEPPKVLHPNDPALVEKYGDDRYTYANPFMLSDENNRLYLFGRWTGFKPNMTWSDDGGLTWTQAKVVVCPLPIDPGQRPYVKYYSNGKDKIHMVFTDGHPRNEPANSVYYAYYQKGAFFRADGHKICTIDELPFEPKEASLVYDARKTGNRAWVWDICEEAGGYPVVAYTRLPEATDHRYHYARYDGKQWLDYEICKAGQWFPQTPEGEEEREQHYSAGISIDPQHPSVVFLSRPVQEVFEIEQWTTADGGKSWASTPVTQHSAYDQVRPFVVGNVPEEQGTSVLWMENKRYVHYTDYQCQIKGALGLGKEEKAGGK